MLQATLVRTEEELHQISLLNRENLKENLAAAEIKQEGFLSWKYPFELLLQLHLIAPSIVIKDGKKVVAYALTTLREAGAFHADLKQLFDHLDGIMHRDQLLVNWPFYCMGQICVHKNYRGKGLLRAMYAKHRETFARRFTLLLTEIASANQRSLQAHMKTGFQTIHTYTEKSE